MNCLSIQATRQWSYVGERSRKLANLPSPEEPILEGIHGSQSEFHNAIFHCLIPLRRVQKQRARRPKARRSGCTRQEKSTRIISVTKFPREGYSKSSLAVKKDVRQWKADQFIKGTHLAFMLSAHALQAVWGQIPPAWSPVPVAIGSVFGLPSKAK